MKTLQHIGIGLFFIALLIFTGMLGLNTYHFSSENLSIDNTHHSEVISQSLTDL